MIRGGQANRADSLAVIIRRALGAAGGETPLERTLRTLFRRLVAARHPGPVSQPELIRDLAQLLAERLAAPVEAGPSAGLALEETWRA